MLVVAFVLLLWSHSMVGIETQGFSLNGVSYPNHGLVLLDEVGEGAAALNCVSNDAMCCDVGSTFPGNYFFPNSSVVPSQSSVGDGPGYYRDRAADRVRLNRVDSTTSGLFRCQIQTVANAMEDLYIGVYGTNAGLPTVSNVVNNGGNSRLTCTSTGGPATTVTWRKNCVMLADSAEYQQTQTVTNTMSATYSNTLTIGSGVTDRDGVYTCSVTNTRGMDSSSTGLGANYSLLPVIVAINQRISPTIGQMYTLMCVMHIADGVATSPISHRWIGPDGSTVGTSSTLSFSSFSESDIGEYGCQVTVGSGANERVGCAVISVAPTIVVTVTGGTVMAGTQHTLTCSVSGAPSGSTKTYTWFKGGTMLSSCTSSQCTISGVQVSDAGTDYICRVSVSRSGMGIATVLGTGTIRVTLPNPTIRFRAGSFPPFYVGLDFSWRCDVENPGPALLGVTADIVWSRDGGEVTSDSRITVGDVVEDSPGVEWDRGVMFSPLGSVDSGSYTCTATIRPTTANAFVTNGMNTNTQEMSIVTPTLTVSVSDPSARVLDVSPYNSFTLTCSASSLVNGVFLALRKTVQWMRSIDSSSLVEISSATNGVTVTDSNLDQATSTSEITVTTTTAGQHLYMCRVSLDVSPATDVISEQDSGVHPVQGPVRPNAPTVLTSSGIFHNRVTIQWTVTSISYDTETYIVEYGTASNSITSTSSPVSSGNDITRTNFMLSVELSGLTRDTQYYYQVVASNTAGSTTSAAPQLTFNTTELAPEPPTSLQFSKLTPTSYSFSWVPPAVTNGILIAHMISCDPQLDGLEVITRSAGSDEISGVVVENLEKGVTYECFVQVQNNVGLSLPSSPVTFTTDEAAPTASAEDFSLSRITMSGRSITVSWSPPNPTDRNGVIISYTVTCIARVSGVTPVTMTYNQAGTHTLFGFRPLTTYDCSIVASNSAGTGPLAATSITTPEDAPSAPENVVVNIIEGFSNTVDISWSPPSEKNGVIIHYDSMCTSEHGQILNARTIGSMTTVRLNGLTVATQYTCLVTASTSGGEGPPGMVHFLTLPAAPTGLLVSGETNSMLTVSWTYDHPDSGENIFGYSIYVDGEIVGTTSNDVMQYNITGLDPFTNYSIQVTAFNDNNGPRSDAVVAITEEDIPGIVGCNSRWIVDGDTVTVNWDQPARPNGVILDYHIELVSYTGGAPKAEVTVGGEERTYAFSIANFSLAPGVPYNVTIAANNSVGVGEECTMTDFTRELRPPNNTLEGLTTKRSENGTMIDITWSVLPLNEVMGFVTLTITFLPSGSTLRRKRQAIASMVECTSSPCSVPYEAGSVRIMGLNPSLNYTIEIQAVNGNNQKGDVILTTSQGLNPDEGLSTTTTIIIAVSVTAAIGLAIGTSIVVVAIIFKKSRRKPEPYYEMFRTFRHFMRDHLTHEPKVTVGGPRKIAIVGLSFSLTCDIAALQTDGNITYEWYRKGLEGCKDEFLRKTEAVLIFSQLQMTNEGGYYCKVSVDGKATRTTDVYRLKPIEPTLAIKESSRGPQLKESFYLKCIVEGDGGYMKRYRWYKHDQVLPLEILPEYNFKVLHMSDAGTYRCEVTLDDSLVILSHDHTIKFKIQSPRVTISATSNHDEDVITLTSAIELSPTLFFFPVTVTTEWEGPDIRDSKTQATFSHSHLNRKTYTSKATIVKANAPQQLPPNYVCKVLVSACSDNPSSLAIESANANGTIELKKWNTTIVNLWNTTIDYPRIRIQLMNKSIICPLVGKNFTLVCTFVTANDNVNTSLRRGSITDVTYKWFKDGKMLPQEKSSALSFRILVPSDAGEYCCLVKNDKRTYLSTYKLAPQCMEGDNEKTIGQITYSSSRPIARGTYSTVYKGFCQTKSGEVVRAAIRVIKRDCEAKSKRELDALRQLDLPTRVLTMYATEIDENETTYIALEYCPMTLVQYVESLGSVHCGDNYSKALKLLYQLVEGLNYLHLCGHVHRDISPSNVLINDNGIPKLSGFGLSDAVAVLSYEGHKGGRDQNDVTPALDVFSMGCLIFFVLTDGIHLFGNEHKRVKDENDIADYRENGSKLEELRETPIASDLVQKMTKSRSEERLTSEEVVRHCLFWNETKLRSMLKAAAKYEDLKHENWSEGNWMDCFPETIKGPLEAQFIGQSTHDLGSLGSLVEAVKIQMENVVADHHGMYIKKKYGLKDRADFVKFIRAKFPALLIRVFEIWCQMKSARDNGDTGCEETEC